MTSSGRLAPAEGTRHRTIPAEVDRVVLVLDGPDPLRLVDGGAVTAAMSRRSREPG